MKDGKKYLKIGMIIIIIIIIISSFYFFKINQKSNYLGYALAQYNENVTYERVIEISEKENLTIIFLYNLNGLYSVRYYAPTLTDAKHIRIILLPYPEIMSVAIYAI